MGFQQEQQITNSQHKNLRKKTFKVPFDWLNLIGVLLIPFVVTVIGLYATQQITQQQILASQEQHQIDIRIANEQQQEAVLQTYIQNITNFLLNNKLLQSSSSDPVREAARIQTLTALLRLNPSRKVILLRFLYEANLVGSITEVHIKDKIWSTKINLAIIALRDADLSQIDLSGSSFAGIDLSNANLIGTNLSSAYLENAVFSETKLNNANLNNADLSGAFLPAVNLGNAILVQAHLHKAVLFLATLNSVNLRKADLGGADLNGDFLNNADLRGANLSGANLFDVNLSGANLKGANLSGANLNQATITAAQLAIVSSLKNTIMPDGSKHP